MSYNVPVINSKTITVSLAPARNDKKARPPKSFKLKSQIKKQGKGGGKHTRRGGDNTGPGCDKNNNDITLNSSVIVF